MIIRIMANALIQCMVRTQAGWIVFAPSGVAALSVAARLDISAPSAATRQNQSRPIYDLNPGFVTTLHAIDAIAATHDLHKKASRVSPARCRASRWGSLGSGYAGLRRP